MAHLIQRQQRGAREAAIAVEAGGCAQQREGLGDGGALGLEIVRAPEHEGHGLGEGIAIGHMARQQTLGLTGAVLGGVFAGDLEGVEPMEVAARGQHVGRAQEVAAGGGIDEAPVERLQDAADLVILRQMLGGGLEGAQDLAGRAVLRDGVHGDAAHKGLHRSALKPLTMGRVGHGEQHVGALFRAERLAHHM